MNLAQHVHQFIDAKLPSCTGVIVAVSGGKDSMALLHALQQTSLKLVVAHCNFNLRGDESANEAVFIQNYCNTHQLIFEYKSFDTKQIQSIQKKSIQETARALRYNWFEELRVLHNVDYIFTAHHALDNAETFLHNIARGKNFYGLKGISPVYNHIARPFIDLPLSAITTYLQQQQIPYCTDSSNNNLKYTRNYIRHHIIPSLEKVNPQTVHHITETSHLMHEALLALHELFTLQKARIIFTESNCTKINFTELKTLPYARLLLYDLLKEFNFSLTQVNEILALTHQSGSYWMSNTHQLILDRTELILQDKAKGNTTTQHSILLKGFNNYEFTLNNTLISLSSTEVPQSYNTPTCLYLDKDKLGDLIEVRTWKLGDKIKPLGMKGHKKLSDLFIDKKISVLAKKEQLVLVSGDSICAVVPGLISDDFKLTKSTKNVLKITWSTL